MRKSDLYNRVKESGNVLFLILIAVALFAALSYAVTQSTRSGGGDASSETNLLNSAQITQYPASIRTSIVRMIISGTDASALVFNPPSDYGLASFTGNEDNGVFHPLGGGATFVVPPGDLITGENTGDGLWFFNNLFDIPNIGTDGAAGKELIAFLTGISDGVCSSINRELGIGGAGGAPTPSTDLSDADVQQIIISGTPIPDTSTVDGYTGNEVTYSTVGPVDTFDVYIGQPFGCFRSSNGTNVYYHVLIEN